MPERGITKVVKPYNGEPTEKIRFIVAEREWYREVL